MSNTYHAIFHNDSTNNDVSVRKVDTASLFRIYVIINIQYIVSLCSCMSTYSCRKQFKFTFIFISYVSKLHLKLQITRNTAGKADCSRRMSMKLQGWFFVNGYSFTFIIHFKYHNGKMGCYHVFCHPSAQNLYNNLNLVLISLQFQTS